MAGLQRREAFKLSRFAITRRTSLVLANQLPLTAWRSVGEYLVLVADSSAWWIGDWLVYGSTRYPDRYQKALAETSLDYQTLKNYAWVARKFVPARRREGLSFQHHVEVAALCEREQDLWLDMAEKLRWTRNQLRTNIRTSRTGSSLPPGTRLSAFELNVTARQRELWQAAANAARLSLCQWMIKVLDSSAGVTIPDKGHQ
jgi:hypothetical protein